VTAAERRAFEAIADAVCAPEPPLPPVAETDAAVAFERWMTAAPAPNRIAARVFLLVLVALRFSRRPRARRVRWLAGPLAEPIRAAASVSYYGDPNVSATVGYVPV
jgi:hypothetical protein